MAQIPFAIGPFDRIINVSWGGGYFAFGGSAAGGNRIQYSTDGENWVRWTSVEALAGGGAFSLAYGAGCWILFASSSGVLYRSTDGTTWTSVLNVGFGVNLIYGQPIAATQSKFYFAGTSGGNPAIWSSIDGITWSARVIGGSSDFISIVRLIGGSLYAATTTLVADSWANHWENTLLKSTNGISWSAMGELGSELVFDTGVSGFESVPASRTIYDLAGGNGKIVALLVVTPPDTSNFTDVLAVCSGPFTGSFGSAKRLNIDASGVGSWIAFGDGEFITGGLSLGSGNIATSADGASWSYLTLGDAGLTRFGSFAAIGRKIVAVANDTTSFSRARSFLRTRDVDGNKIWAETTNTMNDASHQGGQFFTTSLSGSQPS